MKSSAVGYPRIGKLRELKFAVESYFKGESSKAALYTVAHHIKEEQWQLQKEVGIDLIPSHDFSFYDGMLDTVIMLGTVPKRYRDLNLEPLDTYFAMARGYQGANGDVKALAMKKWFNTNYHYMVPEIEADTHLHLTSDAFLEDYQMAKSLGIETKPVVIGGFTFLKLAKFVSGRKLEDYVEEIIDCYKEILKACNEKEVSYIQIDEPILVTDLTKQDIQLFTQIYKEVLKAKGKVKVFLQTYFGDIRDCYREVTALDFDGIGLDFIEGKKNLDLVRKQGFPTDKTLIAGVVNGKNIWKCNYEKVLNIINELKNYADPIIISTSCSLLHVPYTLENETKLGQEVLQYFAFAKEKLDELKSLSILVEDKAYKENPLYKKNIGLFEQRKLEEDKNIKLAVEAITKEDLIRKPARLERQKLQREKLGLPILPTTTIGSFPQTKAVKQNRTKYRNGEITKETYEENIRGFIKECIALQEELDLDVLVHGEYERNDMVEYFGENLSGYVFTEKAWVQSYGTRCVKPPIIFGDIKREKPITVET
ncbi:MAG: 5-methyltetrahydropteroyltriglutamate--homocysteine S-methyltransferase, partial [Cellulosilyticum sp.]|nr:5-methyltetrahydropteroyltriglutamate--homocysteine S-methyltransferase [Cellulosilyticum sp.]